MKKILVLSAASLMMLSSNAIAQDGMPSVEQIFGFLDADQDGFIQQSEAQGPLADNFALIDTDKDAKISPAELKTAMEMRAKMRAEKEAAKAPAEGSAQ
jgi:Ca2+-binding EF-hand superfamily protein